MDGWAAAVIALNSGRVLSDLNFMGGGTSITGVTCLFRNDVGATVVQSEGTLATPASGSVGATMPPQISMVATLQSNVPGRRARGRLYWPAQGATIVSSTLRVSPAQATNVAGVTANLLEDAAGAWPGPENIRPAVISSIGGTATPIVSVRVGDVLDTQRRRRDQFLENFVTEAVS
jgi:hypothetical protein